MGSSNKKMQRSLASKTPSLISPSQAPYRQLKAIDGEDRLRPYDSAQIAIFAVMIFMFIATTTIVIWPLWALMNGATSSPVFGPVFLFKGLFVQCLQYMPGQYQCDNYMRPVFTLTSFEILTRCFGILSCILDGICLILMLVGMECSKVLLAARPNIKVKIMKLVVFLLFSSSIMLL